MSRVIALSLEVVEAIQRASEQSQDGSVLVQHHPEQMMLSWKDDAGARMNTGFPHQETEASKMHEDA